MRSCSASKKAKRTLLSSCLILLLPLSPNPLNATASNYVALGKEAHKKGLFAQAEQQFKKAVEDDQKSSEAWRELGMSQAHQGKYKEALGSLKKAQVLDPDNFDIKMARARVYSWDGQYQKAEALLLPLKKSYPDNFEVLFFEAQLLYFQGKTTQASKRIGPLHTKYPDDSSVSQLYQQIKQAKSEPKPRDRIFSFGYQRSEFSRRQQSDWLEGFAELLIGIDPKTKFHARFQNAMHFDETNASYEVGLLHDFTQAFRASLKTAYTPKSTFLPRSKITSHLEGRIIHGHEFFGDTWLTADLRYDGYREVHIRTLSVGLNYQLFRPFWIEGKAINIFDNDHKHLKGWSTSANWYTPIQGLRLRAGYSDSPESDSGVIVSTLGRFIMGAYQLNEATTAYLSYSRDDRENSYLNKTVSFAMSIGF